MTFVLVTSQTNTYYAKYIYLSARLENIGYVKVSENEPY